MEIFFIRHTTPDIESGICYGHSDIPIKEDVFQNQLQKIKTFLPLNYLEYSFYSSPSKRCTYLCEALFENSVIDERLKELNFGKWELKKWNDIPELELNNWMNNYVNESPPGGESYMALKERCQLFLNDLLINHISKAVVVTHAGFIRSLLSIVINCNLKDTFNFHLDYGAVIRVKIDPKNQTHSLLSLINIS
jgi:alpha-ribazole phosphatase